jgi:hypothetical protein
MLWHWNLMHYHRSSVIPPKHSSPFEQLKHLAPFMGRDGVVRVSGARCRYGWREAGLAYGSNIILAVLYMIQTWRRP